MRSIALVLSLLGCASSGDDKDGSSGDSTLPLPSDTDDDGLAPLAELSSADCPSMTQSDTVTFESSGEERTVTVVVPDEIPEDMPLVFFFHGLLDPGSTPVPTEYMASALNLQSMANSAGVAFILPESGVMERMGVRFFMWAADEIEGADVTLFDDLRTCAADHLPVDLYNVHAMGFSGGGLFTTVIARDRGDTLASIVEMSGGADIEMLTFDEPLSLYDTPAYSMPALLISGGSSDAWPGGGLELVNFSDGTDTLEDHLVEDGHFVVRCEHNSGHTATNASISASWDWIESHYFGEPSPIQDAGIDAYSSLDWCSVPE